MLLDSERILWVLFWIFFGNRAPAGRISVPNLIDDDDPFWMKLIVEVIKGETVTCSCSDG